MPQIHHIALAVKDINATAALYEALFGLEVTHRETVHQQGVKVAFMPGGQTLLELIEPLDDDGGVARFIAKRGEGMHHIAFTVPDVDAALEALKARGVRLIDEQGRPGAAGHRVAFIHPKATGGVLIELVEEHTP